MIYPVLHTRTSHMKPSHAAQLVHLLCAEERRLMRREEIGLPCERDDDGTAADAGGGENPLEDGRIVNDDGHLGQASSRHVNLNEGGDEAPQRVECAEHARGTAGNPVPLEDARSVGLDGARGGLGEEPVRVVAVVRFFELHGSDHQIVAA